MSAGSDEKCFLESKAKVYSITKIESSNGGLYGKNGRNRDTGFWKNH